MAIVLLIINHNFITLPNADSIISRKKQEILNTLSSQDTQIDQFLLSNIVLNNIELKPNHYDSVYYLDSENFNPTIPNHPAIKSSLKSLVSLSKRQFSNSSLSPSSPPSKVGTKLSSLRQKILAKKKLSIPSPAPSPAPSLTDLSSDTIESKLKYFSDSDISDEDDLINEDELVSHNTLSSASIICLREPSEPGIKRKKACKDCTCGLAERQAAAGLEGDDEVEKVEELKKPKVQFSLKELTEVDFTTEGKTGGCGSCSLGDAFRCSGCPFLGLPAFKPGQAISLDGIDDDL